MCIRLLKHMHSYCLSTDHQAGQSPEADSISFYRAECKETITFSKQDVPNQTNTNKVVPLSAVDRSPLSV